MTMCWKLLRLCSAVVQVLSYIECIRMNSIVRLSCDKCANNQNKCCVGTLIAANVAISTKTCARSCQFIIKSKKRIPIVETYTYPRNRNYIYAESTNETPNDIALIVFKYLASQNYVKLSAVEPLALIGLKTFMPMLYYKRPYLRATVILPCDNQFKESNGYYICTSKPFGTSIPTNQQIQGVPLLINDNILGISGYNRQHLTQNAFIAVGPLLSWISATISEAGPQNKTQIYRKNNAMEKEHHSNLSTTAGNKSNSIEQITLIKNAFEDLNKHDLKVTISMKTKAKEETTNYLNEITETSENSATTAQIMAASNKSRAKFIFLNFSNPENNTSELTKILRLQDYKNATLPFANLTTILTTKPFSDIHITAQILAASNKSRTEFIFLNFSRPENNTSELRKKLRLQDYKNATLPFANLTTILTTKPYSDIHITSHKTVALAPISFKAAVSMPVAPTNSKTVAFVTVVSTSIKTIPVTIVAPTSPKTVASTTAVSSSPETIVFSTVKHKSTKIIDSTTVYATSINLTTNVMQWFQNIKSMLRNNPPLVLVLTTTQSTPTIQKTTEFVDLT